MYWGIFDSNSNSKCGFSRVRARGDTVEKHWSHWSQCQNRDHLGSLRFSKSFITPILRIGVHWSQSKKLESKGVFTPMTPMQNLQLESELESQLESIERSGTMPSDWSLYPDNWKEIAARCKFEAGYKCQDCGATSGEWIIRHLTDRNKYITMADEEEMYWHGEDYEDKAVLVQLGVAHLDQNPANCDRANLRVLCRRCHLVYDLPFHVEKAKKTRLNKKHQAIQAAGQLPLFSEVE